MPVTTPPLPAPEQTVHRGLWTVVAVLALLIFVPPLGRRGMTWDGVLYATIARNMAVGIGDVWHPRVSDTFMRHFHEHPPLAFWLESLYFRLLGDHVWVERLYSLSTALATAGILVALWRRLLRAVPAASAYSWLPVLLWLSYCQWCYRHNILENTLGVFTALAVYATLRALDSPRAAAAWALLAGAAVAAAVLSKGPVGLFPAVSPAVAWLTLRPASRTKAALVQCVLLTSAAGVLGCVLIDSQAREYLHAYWQGQVLASVSGQRDAILSFPGRFTILFFLAKHLVIPGGMAASIFVAGWLSGLAPRDPRLAGPTWFCLMTGLSASLPLMASPKQHGHYAAPSWPYFCFALALACLPAAQSLVARLERIVGARTQLALRVLVAGAVVFAVGQMVLYAGKPYRDRGNIRIADSLAQATGTHATVAVLPSSWHRLTQDDQLQLHAYLYRFYFISLWCSQSDSHRILPHLRLEAPADIQPVAYEPLVIDSRLECCRLTARADADSGIRRR